MTTTRGGLLIAVMAAVFALGFMAHWHKPVIVERTRVEYKDRTVTKTVGIQAAERVVRVAGPERIVVKRELVAGKCEETRTIERGPVTTERQEQRTEQDQTRAQVITRVETKELLGQRPGWSLGAYAAIRGDGPAAGLIVDRRLFGPLWISCGGMVGIPGASRAEPVGLVGLKVMW